MEKSQTGHKFYWILMANKLLVQLLQKETFVSNLKNIGEYVDRTYFIINKSKCMFPHPRSGF